MFDESGLEVRRGLSVRDYTVDAERQLVHVRFAGALTYDVIRVAVLDIAGDSRIDAAFVALIDLRAVTSVESLSYEAVRKLAALPMRCVSRRALVADQPAVFGLCRMFATLRESKDPSAVFRNLRDAEEWLGLAGS